MTRDKYLHLFVSLAMTIGIAFAVSLPVAIFGALSFGTAKEVYDVSTGKHDQKEAWADMLWNFIGIASGVAISLFLR
jgi:uncharacterized protein YfiM (DUF2279 family)